MTGTDASLGNLFDVAVRECAQHDEVHVALEHLDRVVDGLFAGERVLRAHDDGMDAQLHASDLEAHSGPERRLHEDEPGGDVIESRPPARGLFSHVQHVCDLIWRELGKRE